MKGSKLEQNKRRAWDKLYFQKGSANRNMTLIRFQIYAITIRACVGNEDHNERKKERLRHTIQSI
jgi:hypothetical protein